MGSVSPSYRSQDLSVIGEDPLRHAGPLHRLEQGVAHRPRRRTLDHFAETRNREWSSMPVTIDGLVPSCRCTPRGTSICQSSIARERSRRL